MKKYNTKDPVLESRLAKFGEYLLRNRIVASGKEIYLVHWARRFYEFSIDFPQHSWKEQLQMYLDSLARDQRTEDWQIDQAEQAIRLLFGNFLRPSNDEIQGHSLIPQDHERRFVVDEAIVKFREALRLKHYAYRTEQTYLEWLKRFFAYCSEKQGLSKPKFLTITSQEVRDYLAFLAIKKKVSASTQNLAFNAILAFCRSVLRLDLSDIQENVRPKKRADYLLSSPLQKQSLFSMR